MASTTSTPARGYTVSEEYLGAALDGRREKFILATKSMARDAVHMAADIQTSLSNLRTDYIDLYQIHNLPEKEFDQVFGPGGAYEALAAAKAAGQIGHIGVTVHNADALRRLVEAYSDRIETVMFPYNIVETQGHDILADAPGQRAGHHRHEAPGRGATWAMTGSWLCALSSNPGCATSPSPAWARQRRWTAAPRRPTTPPPSPRRSWDRCQAIRQSLGSRFCRRCGYCAPLHRGH